MNGEQKSAIEDEIIALERAGLDRWYSGDPMGLIDLFDESVTYFDPTTPMRIDGKQALKAHLQPLVGKVLVDNYDLVNPKVQIHGDCAILSYNLVVHWESEDGTETEDIGWNGVDVYARVEGSWKVVHSNWAHTKPVDALV